ncbi:hypothetical protein VTK73DRAFT_3173 [Phialemonium thermophilum]|uniref:Uncharacterized protein n=1 Tax=Phialemonium thermophilum TaxID=223376 RepID=A0ABR3VJY6_9PEZI
MSWSQPSRSLTQFGGSLVSTAISSAMNRPRNPQCLFSGTRHGLLPPPGVPPARCFSASAPRREILSVATLPDRLLPRYDQSPTSSLLSLHWPQPPRNILLMPKLHAPHVTVSAVEFAKHIHANYPGLNIIFEQRIAEAVHDQLPFPVYTVPPYEVGVHFPRKIDLVVTLGGDGTILRAASLFSMQQSVPPILSFSMGSLGFLGEWRFEEYKRAWREAYMSGSDVATEDLVAPHTQAALSNGGGGGGAGAAEGRRRSGGREDEASRKDSRFAGWEMLRGKSMGLNRASKILLRNRLKVGIYDSNGVNINEQVMPTSTADPDLRVRDGFAHARAAATPNSDGTTTTRSTPRRARPPTR